MLANKNPDQWDTYIRSQDIGVNNSSFDIGEILVML
jgi:hypothetical protein